MRKLTQAGICAASELRRVRCSLVGGQVVVLWLQHHHVAGIGNWLLKCTCIVIGKTFVHTASTRACFRPAPTRPNK